MTNKLNKKISTVVIFTLLVSLVLVGSTSSVYAATTLEYPELQVTPRATKRLEMEAQAEPSRKWTGLWPMQVSGLATLVGGLVQGMKGTNESGVETPNYSQTKDPNGFSPTIGIMVGTTWIVAATAAGLLYTPYQSGYEQIKKLPYGSKRQKLLKERLAEKIIDRAGTFGWILTATSVATNMGASIFMIVQSKSGRASIGTGVIAIAASILPVVFRPHWTTVKSEQRDYKKKIYGPVASFGILAEPRTLNPTPGLTLSLRF